MISTARPPHRRFGLGLVLAGALLIGAAASFFGYVAYSRDRVSGTIVATEGPALPPRIARPSAGTRYVPEVRGPEAFWSETPGEDLLAQFLPVSDAALPAAGLAPPTRVRIPAINLDTTITPLPILDLTDARQYQTPAQVVGHIPESAHPGEIGNTWLFGHLESPIRGEGSVFRDLPEVHDLLSEGRRVYVIVDSADGSFLYQVRESSVIPKEELHLWDSSGRTVTLVTCWPRFVYDKRIVVTTELVGVKLADSGA